MSSRRGRRVRMSRSTPSTMRRRRQRAVNIIIEGEQKIEKNFHFSPPNGHCWLFCRFYIAIVDINLMLSHCAICEDLSCHSRMWRERKSRESDIKLRHVHTRWLTCSYWCRENIPSLTILCWIIKIFLSIYVAPLRHSLNILYSLSLSHTSRADGLAPEKNHI